MTLGLDASTSTCGWAFAENNVILDCGFIDTSKLVTVKEKSMFIIDILDKNPLIKKIDKINLEAALSGFAFGRSSQQVIVKLARFNAVFEYILEDHYNQKINLLDVNTVRKKLFGKCRIKGMKPKDFVKAQLSLIMDLKKWDKFKKKGSWDDRNSDTYDAIVIALY
jgi:Holliday junction resolvasome RuvABC endonuclease subunit